MFLGGDSADLKLRDRNLTALTGLFSHFYKLGENNFANRLDSIGSLTLQDVASGVSQVTGKIGNAASFNGASYLAATSTIVLGGPSFTGAVWFKTSNAGSQYIQAWDTTDDVYPKLNIGLQGAGKVAFWTDAAHKGATTASTYHDNAWHFALYWHDSGTKYNHLWLDNSEHVVDSSGAASDVGGAGLVTYQLGAQSGASLYTGVLDAHGMADNRVPSDGQRVLIWNSGVGREFPF
jgi:hypothetical protein